MAGNSGTGNLAMAYPMESSHCAINSNVPASLSSAGNFLETEILHSESAYDRSCTKGIKDSFLPFQTMMNIVSTTSNATSNNFGCGQTAGLLGHLKRLRDERKYCDVAISVNGRQFWAHRNVLAAWSPLFDLYMCKKPMCSNLNYEVMIVHYDNHEVFSELLDFLYSGYIAPRETHFMQLLYLAVSFQINSLKEDCEEYLRSNLHLENILRTFFISIKYRLTSLEDFVLEYLQKNLSDAVTQNEFLSLSVAKLNKFLTSGKMQNIKPEIKLFLIISWVGCDVSGRQKYLVLLLKHIDWSTVASDFLLEINRTDNFFTSHESGLFLLLQTLHSSNISLGPYEHIYPHLKQSHAYLLSDVLNVSIPNEAVPEADDYCPVAIQMIAGDTRTTTQMPSFSRKDVAVNTDVTGPDIDASQEMSLPLQSVSSYLKPNYVCAEQNIMQQQNIENLVYAFSGSNSQQNHLCGIMCKQNALSYSKNPPTCTSSNLPPCVCNNLENSLNGPNSTEFSEKEILEATQKQTVSSFMAFDDVSQDASIPDVVVKLPPGQWNDQFGNGVVNTSNIESDSSPENDLNTEQQLTTDLNKTNDSSNQKSQSYQNSGNGVFETPCNLSSHASCSITRFESQNEQNLEKDVSVGKNSTSNDHEENLSAHFEGNAKSQFGDAKCSENVVGKKVSVVPSTPLKDQSKLHAQKKNVKYKSFYSKISKKKAKKKCRRCSFSSSTLKELHGHVVKEHRKRKPVHHCCDICGFAEKGKAFFDHMRKHFPGPPFKCKFQDSCKFEGKNIHALLLHRTSHTKIRQYNCEKCNMSFYTRNNLLQHKKIHYDDRPYECKICGSAHKAKCTLKQHMATHSKDRQYLCDYCGFATKYQSYLKAHKRIHSGEAFHCEVKGCSYFTVKRSQLKSHMKIHSDVREFPCQECGKCFKEKGHLKRHLLLHKSDAQGFRCCEITHTECEFESKRMDKLKEHIRKYHGDDSVGKTFKARRKRSQNVSTVLSDQNEMSDTRGSKTIQKGHFDHAYTRRSDSEIFTFETPDNKQFTDSFGSTCRIVILTQGPSETAFSGIDSLKHPASLHDSGSGLVACEKSQTESISLQQHDQFFGINQQTSEKNASSFVSLLNMNS